MHRSGVRADIIAERFGVCRDTVYRALKRDDAIVWRQGPDGKRTKQTAETIARFLDLYRSGVALTDISAATGIGWSTVRNWSAALGTRAGLRAGANGRAWWTPERNREVIRMKRIGATNAEICAALGCANHGLRDQWTRIRAAYRARGVEPPPGRPGRPSLRTLAGEGDCAPAIVPGRFLATRAGASHAPAHLFVEP